MNKNKINSINERETRESFFPSSLWRMQVQKDLRINWGRK